MRRLFVSASQVLCLAVLMAFGANAQPVDPGKEGELGQLLAPQPGNHICFGRSYSADHLKAHPKQTVADVQFRLAYYRHDPDKYAPQGQRNYYFALFAKLRGSSKTLKSLGECTANGDLISCNVECDGGGVKVKRRPDNKLLVYFQGEESYLRMTEGCDEEEDAVDLKPGSDDKEFLLAQSASCPAYDEW